MSTCTAMIWWVLSNLISANEFKKSDEIYDDQCYNGNDLGADRPHRGK